MSANEEISHISVIECHGISEPRYFLWKKITVFYHYWFIIKQSLTCKLIKKACLLIRLYSCPMLIAKYPSISFMNMLIYVRETQVLSMQTLPLIRSKEGPSQFYKMDSNF